MAASAFFVVKSGTAAYACYVFWQPMPSWPKLPSGWKLSWTGSTLVAEITPVDATAGVWTRSFGNGKVFVTLLGHNGLSFQTPEFQKIVLNGVNWATS